MTQRGHWTDRLSDYLDGELEAGEAEACEAHLAACAECADALAALRVVVAQASLLPAIPPTGDLWPGIESRLEPRTGYAKPGVVPIDSRRRIAATVPQLAAAAIALIVLTAGAMWLMLPPAAQSGTGVAGAEERGLSPAGQEPTQVVFLAAYEPAISELEAAFEARRRELDPETARIVEQNLAIIDQAIAEANQALAEDPSSAFLTTHLAGAMRQKVDLLRRVTNIAHTES